MTIDQYTESVNSCFVHVYKESHYQNIYFGAYNLLDCCVLFDRPQEELTTAVPPTNHLPIPIHVLPVQYDCVIL